MTTTHLTVRPPGKGARVMAVDGDGGPKHTKAVQLALADCGVPHVAANAKRPRKGYDTAGGQWLDHSPTAVREFVATAKKGWPKVPAPSLAAAAVAAEKLAAKNNGLTYERI